jgi:preprotein translocase subunit SecA
VARSADELAEFTNREELLELILEDATANYQKKCEEFSGGLEQARAIERDVYLQLLDQRWQLQMSEMDHLLDGIHLRAHAQQDPLVAWQREGYTMFEKMLEAVDADYARFILNIREVVQEPDTTDMARATTNAEMVEQTADATLAKALATSPTRTVTKTTKDKIGRNDPCYCGSGRKYKQCHGRP